MLNISYFEDSLNAIFLLLMIICGWWIPDIIPCGVKKLLTKNIIYKYILLFIILIISVILTHKNVSQDKSLLFLFGLSLILYILFVCMTKMNAYFFIILFFLLIILYICINYYKYNDLSDKDKKIYDILTKTIFILSILIIIIGFLLYYGEKKYEYKKLFNWRDFFLKNIDCNYTPPKGSMKDYFLAIFNKNNI